MEQRSILNWEVGEPRVEEKEGDEEVTGLV